MASQSNPEIELKDFDSKQSNGLGALDSLGNDISEFDQKRMQDEMKASSTQKTGMTRDKLMFGIIPSLADVD